MVMIEAMETEDFLTIGDAAAMVLADIERARVVGEGALQRRPSPAKNAGPSEPRLGNVVSLTEYRLRRAAGRRKRTGTGF